MMIVQIIDRSLSRIMRLIKKDTLSNTVWLPNKKSNLLTITWLMGVIFRGHQWERLGLTLIKKAHFSMTSAVKNKARNKLTVIKHLGFYRRVPSQRSVGTRTTEISGSLKHRIYGYLLAPFTDQNIDTERFQSSSKRAAFS